MEIIIGIGTFILGYFAGIYMPLKLREKDEKPKISLSPFQNTQNYFDITNHGGDILNLDIEILWLQDGTEQKRKMDRFYGETENPAFGNSHTINSLKKGQTEKVINCPLYSDDGKITVFIQGKNINKKPYQEKIIVYNQIKK